ncbi:MAG: hypothetical protein DRQ61_08440 [Gammaproteobacteria bacterium]|nr:MAG: hypothetical protein DRQ61_08440 [Gammaproteobacteria bacterium]
MIVGTILFLTILFGGGVIETFFVSELDKGVKEYVVDKERRKDILADLKISKQSIKQFNKDRKKQLKRYKKLNASRSTTLEELNNFYVELHNDRLLFQNTMIVDRIAITKKIQPDEWVAIMALAEVSIDKHKEKAQKKADKKKKKALKKDPDYVAEEDKGFDKTRKSVQKNVADMNKQQLIINGLDEMISSFKDLNSQIVSINVKENSTLINQNSSKTELKKITEKINTLRDYGFNKLNSMHMLIKENTTEGEWDNVIKAFNNELSGSIR